MGDIVYMDDFRPGVHAYTPEMGQRKPNTPISMSIGHYGGHYLTTRLELKGRGIKLVNTRENGVKVYRVTPKALAKLETQYPIGYECNLD